jgi:hypothetical protein
VDSRIEFLIGDIMTHAAIDLFQLLSVGELINGCILVAVDTLHKLMYGTPITLEVHIERYRTSTSFCC